MLGSLMGSGMCLCFLLVVLFLACTECAVVSLARAFAPRSASAILEGLAADARAEEVHGAQLTDVYGEGDWLRSFEDEVALHLGKDRGLFVPTGVCAQLMALSVHAGLPLTRNRAARLPASLVLHETSHLEIWEERAVRKLPSLRSPHRPLEPRCATVRNAVSTAPRHGRAPGGRGRSALECGRRALGPRAHERRRRAACLRAG